ncbi:MAG: GWxTD domain-containing protein [Ignavibacteriales bacterium]|nr:GWxTD domain-containing protein [Ignavibacteriales bacterium]
MKIIVFLFFLCTSISFSQFSDEIPRSAPRSFNPITFEVIPYWTNDTTSIDLIVFYRINPELFFFAKTSMAQQEIYEAKGELVFEIFDEKDVAIARDFRPLRIERNSLPAEGVPFSEEIQGALTFKLKKGLYKIVVETKDSESGKSFINRDAKIDARTFSAGLNVSPAIFVEPLSSDTLLNKQNEFFPMNRGGSVVLGQVGRCLLQVISPDTNTDIHLAWKVNSKNEADEDSPQKLLGEYFVQQNGTPIIIENSKHTSISIKKDSKYSRIIFFPIPTERLETGKYQMSITVTQGTQKATKDFFFNIIWPLKPYSLSDFKLAIDAVRHIATEEELDSMTAFSSSKSVKAFRAFWHKRNPDTTRAFNPAMAEYYRRVDETIKRFSSTNEMDGYKTDRGRIYILFGSPSITNRLLKPNSAPTEIWTYEKLKRRFTFTDQRKTGNYILMKMENY